MWKIVAAIGLLLMVSYLVDSVGTAQHHRKAEFCWKHPTGKCVDFLRGYQ